MSAATLGDLESLVAAFNENQARVPKGNGRISGRWVDTPATLGRSIDRLVPDQPRKGITEVPLSALTSDARRQLAREALQREGFPSLEELAARVTDVYDRSNQDTRERGIHWYDEANGLARELSQTAGVSVEKSAAVISHLSPGSRWDTNNISDARIMLSPDPPRTFDEFKARGGWQAKDMYTNALQALDSDTPLDTFSDISQKTESFAHNILGDPTGVTIDTWALKVLGYDKRLMAKPPNAGRPATAEGTNVSRKQQIYEGLAEAYRLAAEQTGIDPRIMQAITWVQVQYVERPGEGLPPPWLEQVLAASGVEDALALFTDEDLEPLGYYVYMYGQINEQDQLTAAFNPSQARVPRGNGRISGRWVLTPGSLGRGLSGEMRQGLVKLGVIFRESVGTPGEPGFQRGLPPVRAADPDHANKMRRQLSKAFERIPARVAKDQLNGLEFTVTDEPRPFVGQTISGFDPRANRVVPKKLEVSQDWVRLDTAAYDVLEKAGHWVPSDRTDAGQQVIDHEVGHAVDRLLKDPPLQTRQGQTLAPPGEQAERYMAEIDAAFSDFLDAWAGPEAGMGTPVAELLSKYGSTTEDEFIAEAWGEYTGSDNPRPIATRVGQIIEKYLKLLDDRYEGIEL